MLCQHCQSRIANVHFTQIINGSKVEIYLCEECAKVKGHFSFGSPLNISDFFSGIMGGEQAGSYITAVPQQIVCEKCGMSYEDFQKVGKLGCDHCYEIFADKLNPLFRRLQGSIEHNGKVPARVSDSLKASKEVEKLRALLNKAIQSEEYEKAAEIRDQIRNIEAGS